MRTIIAGGRRFVPTREDWDWLDAVHRDIGISVVVSGQATGADAFGERWANINDIQCVHFEAKWRVNGVYNHFAGKERNEEMAQHAQACILLPGGVGTRDMGWRAQAHGPKVITR